MKASSLFGLTVALLLGLGVLVGAKYTGMFDAAPAPVEAKKNQKPPLVLVATRNLVRGIAAMPGDAKLRPLNETERAFYEKNSSKLLAAVPRAADYRVLARSVAAGQLLMEEHFEPYTIPESLSSRLDPGMRSVSLSLPTSQAAGGLLRVGERVDVLLTAKVQQNPCKDCQPMAPFTATAVIARNLKIAVKRDMLVTVMAPIVHDKPISFILEANPYRAALIDYAKGKGTITLTPAIGATQTIASRDTSTNEIDSREYRDEDKRVQEFVNNESIVSDGDLERIFNLKARPLPPAPVVAAPKPIEVELMVGLRLAKRMVIDDDGVRYESPRPLLKPAPDPVTPPQIKHESAFRFSSPTEKQAPAAPNRPSR
jgi:Flp pilus assembly protein CpaB